MTYKKRWKFLDETSGKIRSHHGDCTWTIGEWKHEDRIRACSTGFHCSGKISEAFSYVKGNVVARVEVRGYSLDEDDKSVHQDMRIIQAWHWTKQDSVALAVYATELVLGIFEAKRPGDGRPRKAIEAARRYLETGDAYDAYAAAYDAYDAYAVNAAVNAAYAANAAVNAAAYAAANAAAYAAAYAANAAVNAAANAANAAKQEMLAKIETWMVNRIKTLEPIQ